MKGPILLTATALLASLAFAQTATNPPAHPGFRSMFQPLTAPSGKLAPAEQEKVRLGRMLFFDKRLSKAGNVSCASCHNLSTYGVDNERVSTGHNGQKGNRNAPTVYNSGLQLAQFWDGRARDLAEQAKGPVLNPVEMALASDEEVVKVLKGVPAYVTAFKKAFPKVNNPITFDNMALAIAAFEDRLVTPSRWDRYLKGEEGAITPDELAGAQTFISAGCSSCHSGTLIGGTNYQKLGVAKAWTNTSDPGRYNVTKDQSDRLVFKVPMLRNIAKTGPYFHDGSIDKLDDAVRVMGEYQVGRKLDDKQIQSIVTWLQALTGDLPVNEIKEPKL